MIYLVHGPDTVSSRTFLLKLKSQYPSYETVNFKILKENLSVFLQSQNLFGNKKLLVIENFTPEQAKPLKPQEDIDLAIWLEDLITPPSWIDKSVPFKQIDQNSTFKLADAIAFGSEKQALTILEKLLLENTASELIIGALTRQIKLLSLGYTNEWEKVSKSPFLISKIREQLYHWNRKKLKAATLLLLKADWDLKSGGLARTHSLTQLVSRLCQLAKLA
ncbi:MAG TPA: hypothetical protein VIH52_04545 [Candidatus Nanoarchaeia archaeon]